MDLYLKGDPEKNIDGWISVADELRRAIEETRQRQHQERSVLQEELRQLSTTEQQLQSLLDGYPKIE